MAHWLTVQLRLHEGASEKAQPYARDQVAQVEIVIPLEGQFRHDIEARTRLALESLYSSAGIMPPDRAAVPEGSAIGAAFLTGFGLAAEATAKREGEDWADAIGGDVLPEPVMPCPVRSSITDQPCVLPEGHQAESPMRFHKYAPPLDPGKFSADGDPEGMDDPARLQFR